MISSVGKFLMTKLKEIHANSYNEQAPYEAKFPYVTMLEMPTDFGEGNKAVVMLNFEIWDNKSSDIATLCSIQENIIDTFDHMSENTDEFTLYLEKNGTSVIPDTDPKIRRRRVQFVLIYYDKKRL